MSCRLFSSSNGSVKLFSGVSICSSRQFGTKIVIFLICRAGETESSFRYSENLTSCCPSPCSSFVSGSSSWRRRRDEPGTKGGRRKDGEEKQILSCKRVILLFYIYEAHLYGWILCIVKCGIFVSLFQSL